MLLILLIVLIIGIVCGVLLNKNWETKIKPAFASIPVIGWFF